MRLRTLLLPTHVYVCVHTDTCTRLYIYVVYESKRGKKKQERQALLDFFFPGKGILKKIKQKVNGWNVLSE